MPTTFNWIYLGNGPSIDPTEGNADSENASALVGTTWGGTGSPLYTRITSATTIDNGGNAGNLDTNNSTSNDQFTTDIGSGTQTFTFDAVTVYNVTVTYVDGTTATITGVLAQSTTGELFLAPELATNADTTALEAKPILSITLDSVNNALNTDFGASRLLTGFDDGVVDGTAGNDLINSAYVEPLTDGSDRIDNNDGLNTSSLNDDRILAGAGNDTVLAGVGNDLVYGGTGNDSLSGETGNDTIYGEDGDDRLYGGANSDLLYGGIGVDSLYGDAGTDLLYGEVGDDLIYGGTEADTIYGGVGADTLFGGNDADQVFGGDGDDRVFGGLGNDSIDSGTGSDLVYGDGGDDTIIFGTGDDTVYGGDGNDIIDDVSGSNLSGVNLLYGGAGNDTVWSGNDADTLYGDAGNDVLNGEAGNDVIFGGADSDVLSGAEGNDVLTGGTGADSIFGGDDQDQISATFADVVGSEVVDGGSGAGTSADDDTLRVDITGFGWGRIDLAYDPLNSENGTITFFDALGAVVGTLTFTDIENLEIICFTAGTRIMTDRGLIAVEDLTPGVLVLTRDNGLQPLRWMGCRVMSGTELRARPELQPVRIGAGALGEAGPERSMMVSPQHRVLIEGARAEMYFGEGEVLVPAKHLLGMAEVTRALPSEGVTYVHILFDRHEIVLSEGLWTESFQPAERTLSALDVAARDEVLALFPELATDVLAFPSARLSLKAHEAKVLISS